MKTNLICFKIKNSNLAKIFLKEKRNSYKIHRDTLKMREIIETEMHRWIEDL